MTCNSVMWEIRLKIANLVSSKMFHLQVTCEIPCPRQEVSCPYFGSYTLICISMDVSSQRRRVWSLMRLKQVTRMDGFPNSSRMGVWIGNIVYLDSKGKFWASQTRTSHSVSFTHLTITYLNQLTMFQPTFQNSSHSTQLSNVEDSSAVIQMINKGRSAKIWGTTEECTESSWIGCSKERFWIILSWKTTHEQADQLADILTEGMFTTMQWRSFLIFW